MWRALVLLLSALPAFADQIYVGKVIHIADGDTLMILADHTRLKIRLAEIDAPEKGQPYGNKSKKALGDLAFGKQARVVVVDRERYGRTVGRVYIGELDVNAEMVRTGYAWVFDMYVTDRSLYSLQAAAPLGALTAQARVMELDELERRVTAMEKAAARQTGA